MQRGPNMRKLDLFKSKLHRNQEAQKTAGVISNDMDIFKLHRKLLPLGIFTLKKKPRKRLFATDEYSPVLT